jgi:nucleoside-diphosphate-sugar epimerase
VPVGAGTLAGSAVEALWTVRRLLGRPAAADPPMTRFLAEQLSTAHWFDQRETQRLLAWRPAVDLATGFARLAAACS